MPAVEEDAFDLLTNDHDEIMELFDRYEQLATDDAPADERQTLAEEICSFLLVAAKVKEELFYPAARQALDDDTLVDEALVAQDSALSMIDELQSGDPTTPRYDEQVKMLHELIAQSFEEESDELFSRLRATALDLEELGAEMSARQELLLTIGDDARADAP